jgi:hypothetical protein
MSSKKIQVDGRTAATPKSVESSDESEVDLPILIRSRPQASPKVRPAYAPLENSGRQRKRGRPSMGDVVEQLRGPRSDYTYSPLKGDEIRLLIIHAGQPWEQLTCRLVTESLQSCQPYQALSYRWGTDQANIMITHISYKAAPRSKPPSIRDIIYSKFYTTPNLFDALKQLRQVKENITLYVNAFCINHEDKKEKYAQTLRTQEIFHRASHVIVWLGKETATSKKAFEFIPQVLNLNLFDGLLKDNSKTNDWIALAELMRNPLFGRRWLIQELAVAKIAILHCGGESIGWSEFADAVVLFESNLQDIRRFFTSSWMASGGPMDDIHALGASKLVTVVSNIIRKTPDGKTLNRLETLESLVSTLSVFEATDPLDTIIAVIGLAKDQAQLQQIQSRIDENQGVLEVLEVYTAFVEYCVNSGSIDIICRHWAPEMREPTYLERLMGVGPTKIDLPSWIPRVSGSAFGAPVDNLKGRVNGDSFVGMPNHRIYNAAFGFPLTVVSFDKCQADAPASNSANGHAQNGHPQFDGIMRVQGYVLDIIAELGARAAQGLIIRESLEMGGWTLDSQTVPERLWRTLVADRGHNNACAPSWFQRACLQCLEQSDQNGDFNTTALLNQPHCPDTSAAFLRRVQSVIWNRKFLLSKAEVNGGRLFGLAPADAKVGDLICILFGCSVPVILREHLTEDHYFEVIGESFIYGMMEGEARVGLSDEDVKAKAVTFKLR